MEKIFVNPSVHPDDAEEFFTGAVDYQNADRAAMAWLDGVEQITGEEGAEEQLGRYNRALDKYEAWATAEGHQPFKYQTEILRAERYRQQPGRYAAMRELFTVSDEGFGAVAGKFGMDQEKWAKIPTSKDARSSVSADLFVREVTGRLDDFSRAAVAKELGLEAWDHKAATAAIPGWLDGQDKKADLHTAAVKRAFEVTISENPEEDAVNFDWLGEATDEQSDHAKGIYWQTVRNYSERYADVRHLARPFYEQAATTAQDETSVSEFTADYYDLDQEQRGRLMELIHSVADQEGVDVEGWFNNTGTAFARTFENVTKGSANFLTRQMRRDEEAILADPEADEERKLLAKGRLGWMELQADARNARNLTRRQNDSGLFSRTSNMIAGSVPYFVAFTNPFSGAVGATSFMQESRERLRREAPDMSPEKLDSLSNWIGGAEAGVQEIQNLTLGFGRLGKLGNVFRDKGAAARWIMRAGATGFAENVEEIGQQYMYDLGKDIAGRFDETIPETRYGDTTRELIEVAPEMALTSLFFGMIGASASGRYDAQLAKGLVKAQEDGQLPATFLGEEAIARVEAIEDPLQKLDAFREEFANQDPDERLALAKEFNKEKAAELMAKQEAAEQARLEEAIFTENREQVREGIDYFQERMAAQGQETEVDYTPDEALTAAEYEELAGLNRETLLRAVRDSLESTGVDTSELTEEDLLKAELDGVVVPREDLGGFAVRLAKGATLDTVIEEFGEGFLAAELRAGNIELDALAAELIEFQKGAELTLLPEDYFERDAAGKEGAAREAFSTFLRGYARAVAEKSPDALPEGLTGALRRLFQKAVDLFRVVTDTARAILTAQEAGNLSPDLETLAAKALGLDQDFIEANIRERAAAGILAEDLTMRGDMDAQAKWMLEQAKEAGYSGLDELAAQDLAKFRKFAEQWRENHPVSGDGEGKIPDSAGAGDATPPKRKRKFGQRSAARIYFEDNPFISSLIHDHGGLISKSRLRRESPKRWKKLKGEYDDAPKLHPSHNIVYSKTGGSTVDVLATNMGFDSVPEFWARIKLESEGALAAMKSDGQQEAAMKQKADFEEEAFSEEEGDLPVYLGDLEPGTVLVIDGEPLEVLSVRTDPEGHPERVVLKDGTRWDRQVLDDIGPGGDTVFVEHIQRPDQAASFSARLAPNGATSEDFEINPDSLKKYRAPAMLWKGKVYEGAQSDNHATIAEKHGFPKDMVPGFVTNEGEFHYQYLEDAPQEDFSLEAQTEEGILDEAAKAAQNREMETRRARRLTGGAGDLTADMFGGGETPLFNERRDGGQSDFSFSARTGPIEPRFYSQLEKVLAAKFPGKAATADQIKGVLTNPQNRVKAEEIKWTGILPKLEELAGANKGKVPMAELRQWLETEGRIGFEEVTHGAYSPEVQSLYNRLELKNNGLDFDYWPEPDQQEWMDGRGDPTETQYDQYTLPGGENYRETVLTIPGPNAALWQQHREAVENGDFVQAEEINGRILESGQTKSNEFTSSHFSNVPNYVAHMRTAEHGEGLLIEEIQSDRHQQARKDGYKEDTAKKWAIQAPETLVTGRQFDTEEEARNWIDNGPREEIRAYNIIEVEESGNIPDAPFRKDWALAMFKRALRDAIAGGQDWIGWTTGDTQADRYDLSKQIDSLEWTRHEAEWEIQIETPQGPISRHIDEEGELADTIGKELADRIITETNEGKTNNTYRGLELKVGGEGMKGFYDKILPKAVAKYVKQWGAKVERTTQLFEAEADIMNGEEAGSADLELWKVEIPPVMRDTLLAEGQATFAARMPGTASVIEEEVSKIFTGLADRVKVGQRMAKRIRAIEERVFKASFGQDDLTERQQITQAVAQLDAIVGALPVSIQGKIGGSSQVAAKKSEAGRRAELVRRLHRAGKELDKYLDREYRERIGREMKKAGVKVSDARNRKGKIGGLGHKVIDQAERAKSLTLEQAEAEAARFDGELAEIESPSFEEFEEFHSLQMATDLFYDWQNATVPRLEQALEFVQRIYQEGREEWISTLKARKEEREAIVEEARGLQGSPEHVTRAAINQAKKDKENLAKAANEGVLGFISSHHHILARIVETSKDKEAAREWANRLVESRIAADFNTETEIETIREAYFEALGEILGTTKGHKIRKWLYEKKQAKESTVTTVEGRKVERVGVPKQIVEALLRRDVGGFDDVLLDDRDLDRLQTAWEEYEELPTRTQALRRKVFFERVVAKGERIPLGQLSETEALQIFLTLRQPDQAAKLEEIGYDDLTLAQLDRFLSPEMKAIGAWMIDHLAKEGKALDKVHTEEFGAPLATVFNYFPVKNRVTGELHDLDPDDPGAGRTISPAAIKQRVTNRAEPDFVDAFAVFFSHVAEMSYWKHNVGWVRKWGGVIKNTKFADRMRVTVGWDAYNHLAKYLTTVQNRGQSMGEGMMDYERVIKKMISRMSLAVLGARVSTMWINGTAFLNAFGSSDVSTVDLLKNMVALMFDGKGALKETWRNELQLFRRRYGASFEAQIAMQTGKAGHYLIQDAEKLAQLGLRPMNEIDVATNSFTFAAIYRATYTKALKRLEGNEALAREEADRAVTRAVATLAQPTLTVSRSPGEVKFMRNPFGAMAMMFRSEVRKNLANNYVAWRGMLTGKGVVSRKRAMRQALLYSMIYPAVVTAMRELYKALTDDDDPEEIEKRLSDPMYWVHNMAADNLAGFPILGDASLALLSKGTGQKYWEQRNPIIRAWGDAVYHLGKIGEDGKTPSDQIDGLLDTTQALGAILPGGPILAELANLAEFGKGVTENGLGVQLSEADAKRNFEKRIRQNKESIYEARREERGDASDQVKREIDKERREAFAAYLKAELKDEPEKTESFLEEDKEKESPTIPQTVRKLLEK